MDSDEPHSEDEFLQRESRLAREALLRLRGEVVESLGRTADVGAWTSRYPWPAMGTAATAGIAAGWALGRTWWRSKRDAASTTVEPTPTEGSVANPSAEQQPHAASRLVSGLGTLTGALASAAVAAATQAVAEIVKETVHDSLHPQVESDADEIQSDAP